MCWKRWILYLGWFSFVRIIGWMLMSSSWPSMFVKEWWITLCFVFQRLTSPPTIFKVWAISSFNHFLSDYRAYTDPSRFRPRMFQKVYDDFQREVSKDITQIIASGISYISKDSPQSHINFANAIFLAILLPFLTIPIIAVALPFICIKNLSIALIPTISFDLFLKMLLSSAYVIQRPSSVLCILEGWHRRCFNRKPKGH